MDAINPNTPVVRVFRQVARRFWGGAPAWPTGEAEWLTLAVRRAREAGAISATLVADARAALRDGTAGELHRIDPRPWPWELALTALKADAAGYPWDAILDVQCWVEDAGRFVGTCSALITGVEGEIEPARVRAWLAERIDFRLRDAVGRYSAEDLVERQAMPAQAWEARLTPLLDEFGLRCAVSAVRYRSASAELAREQKLEREHLHRQQEAERQRLEDEVRRQQEIESIDRQRKALELDRTIGEAARREKLAELDQQALRQAATFQQEQEAWRLGRERMTLEHEEALAASRQRLAGEQAHHQALLDARLQAERERLAAEQATAGERLAAERERIAADGALNEAKRRAELERIELDRKLAQRKFDAECERLDREAEQRRTEKELAEQRMKADREELERRKERLTQAEAQAKDDTEKQNEAIDLAAAQAAGLTGQLHGGNPFNVHQAKERLTSPEVGFAPEILAAAGIESHQQQLIQSLRKKETAGGKAVRIRKADLQTRNIGTRRRIDVLKVDSTLNFTLQSDVAGYLTLFNVGTSGACTLMAPSVVCPTADCRVTPGTACEIPGPSIIPRRLELVENGPPGWEHIVAIVSDFSLVAGSVYAGGNKDEPFSPIEPARISRWLDRLESEGDPWAAAVLSFKVEA